MSKVSRQLCKYLKLSRYSLGNMFSRHAHNKNGMDTSTEPSAESSFISIKSVNKTFSISKNRNLTIGLLFLTFISAVLILYSEPDVINQENSVVKDLGELHLKEQHMHLLFRLLNEETHTILNNMNNALLALPSNLSADPDVRRIFSNFTKAAKLNFNATSALRPPSIFHFLPHLLSDVASLRPKYHLSKNRSGVSAVIGIPTVKRASQSYLLATLNDLIEKMSNPDKEDTLIVILVAEVDENYVLEIVNDIKSHFEEELESGLIDIISPQASYYPDFDKLQSTLSDPMERVRWRSKQCLDFAFLMMYSYPKSMFYIQLEDDIMAKNNYLSVMKNTALSRIANNQPWFVLDFCQLGFIGKMFRSVDLPWIIQFFFMFFNDKPVDWLLDGLIQTKACNLEKDAKDCKLQKDKLWIHNKPSLFQHIGTTSSLKGKVQKLKEQCPLFFILSEYDNRLRTVYQCPDAVLFLASPLILKNDVINIGFNDKHFGKIPLFYPHTNPPAFSQSSIKPFKRYTLQRAYNGETFFWGSEPQSGDWISFTFEKPLNIKRIRFKSGNFENPSDKFSNTSVLAHFVISSKTDSPARDISKISFLKDGSLINNTYSVVGSFNSIGIAEASFNSTVPPVKELKLVLHNASKNWVILNEILIEEWKNRRR